MTWRSSLSSTSPVSALHSFLRSSRGRLGSKLWVLGGYANAVANALGLLWCVRARWAFQIPASPSQCSTRPLSLRISLFLFRATVCVRALIARLKAATEAVFTKYGHKVSHRSNDSLTEIGASKQDILGRTIKSWQNLNIIILFDCALE